MPGGEQRVVELLERESRKSLNKPLLEEDDEPQQHKRSFFDFFCRPNMLGENLLTIEKFGLVQYVSYGKSLFVYFYVNLTILIYLIAQMILKTFCAFLALVLEIFGVYGDGEFKWYYGYVSLTSKNISNFAPMLISIGWTGRNFISLLLMNILAITATVISICYSLYNQQSSLSHETNIFQ